MVRTQIQLSERQASVLKKRAAREGVSMAELIRRGVDLYLHTDNTMSDEERRQRALQAAGRFNSGCNDVAEHHDKYLSKAYGR